MEQTTAFLRVCSRQELPETEGAALADVDGRRIALVVDGAGAVHAVDDTCSHANVSLSEGEVEDCTIECWLHGSRFDVRTGEPTGLPATQPVAVYPVRVDGDDVLVSLTAQNTTS